MIYRLLHTVVLLMSYIPFPVAQFMGKMLGVVFAMIPLERTTISLDNIRKSFGNFMERAELKKLNRKVLIHFTQMLFEVPHIMRLSHRNLNRYVVFDHKENLLEAIEKRKGVFFLTGHFGNWELMAAAVTLLFKNTAVVVRSGDFLPLDKLMNDLRSRFGTEIISKQRAMRKVMAAIKEKKLVGILLDQNVDWYEGVFVKFLGRRACTNKGLALMALKTGTPVVPVFSVRQRDGRYRIIFGKEVKLLKTGDKTKDVEENTALFTNIIERYIRRYPDNWFWFHRRWKTRPYCSLPDNLVMIKVAGKKSIDKSKINRILIRATNWVGDVVMTIPALEAVRDNFPASTLVVLARPSVIPLFANHPAVNQVLPIRKGRGYLTDLVEIIRVARMIRRYKFDLAILFQNAFEAALLAFLGGIRFRVGYNTDGRRFFLSHAVIRNDKVLKLHQVEYYLSLLKAMGWTARSKDSRLFIAEKDMETMRSLLLSKGIGEDDFLLGLSPGAVFGPAKRWPAERFAFIGDRASKRWGAKVVVLGSEEEKDIGMVICKSMKHAPLNLCGMTTIGEAMALIKRCSFFVTNDSGLMHIADALSVPMVAIFGSTDPVITGPRSKKAGIVKHRIDCSPCLKPECHVGYRCMLDIEPEEVWKDMEILKEKLQ